MTPIEIIVIIAVALFLSGVIGSYVYKKIKHMPTGDCCDCAKRMKKSFKKAVKDINK